MKGAASPFYWMIVLLTLTAGQVQAAVQVQAQVDRSRPIYAGSRFAYSIIVANGGQPDNIDLSPLKMYNPSAPSAQNRTSTINGRTSSYQILTYQLLAPAVGDYTIPSVDVNVDGKSYTTNPVEITVVEAGTTKKIDVEMNLSTQTCYVGQPVILTLSFYVWTDVVRANQIANIDIQIPILESDDFYREDIDSQAMKGTQSVMAVNGRKEYVYQDQLLHNGVDCVRVRFTKVLIPKRAGTFDVEPASVSADLAVANKSQGQDRFFGDFFGPQYEYERFRVQTKPVTLEGQALPQTGKPDGFYGLVGNYTISADATPTDVNVGDPITLTIRIGGSPYLKPVQWPDLEKIPQMAESFKIPPERSDGQIKDDAKVFTQTIRPNNADVEQIPPIPLSFFDAESGRYRTVYTKAIPLQVSPTRIVTGGDVETRQLSTGKKQIKAVKEGLSANYSSSDALINQRFSLLGAMVSPVFICLYAVPLIALIVSVIVRYILSDSPQRQAAVKRRRAYSQAVKQLRHAADDEKSSQQVLTVLKQYIADKFSKSAGALTAQDCGSVIYDKTNNAELSRQYQDVMEQTEASEYSPTAFRLTEEKQKELLGLLAEIEKKVK